MRSKDSPYATGFLSANINFDFNDSRNFKERKKEEKETHKSPDLLPYELRELPICFATIVENAIKASKIIEPLLESNNIKDKKELANLKNNMDKLVMYLFKNVDNILDKHTIGGKMDVDDK
jgi:hypothetical protein